MKTHFIIIFIIINFVRSDDYNRLMYLTYKPIQQSAIINLQIAFYDSDPAFGIQWWVSNNLQLSAMISKNIYSAFNLYNNISLGYYNQNLKWLYSQSNLLELSLHKIKYDDSYSNWINCAYKSRYNYSQFIFGYDLNYYFWKNIENQFLSLIVNYKISKKIILELKSDINNNNIFSSFNISMPL